MGGTLEPDETPGGGLTMTLSLPAVPAAETAPVSRSAPTRPPEASPTASRPTPRPAQPHAQQAGPVTTVLVVDDEPQILRALRINLRVRQYDVHTAGSGGEALEIAAEHPPDLVILDLGLPDLDGVDVIHGPARLDRRADHRAVGPGRQHRQGRGAGRRRRRLRHQAVRHGRAAGPDAGGQQARSAPTATTPQVRLGDLVVDLAAKRVIRAGRARTADRADIRLTPTEWHLLEVLLRNPGKLLSQQQLLAEVWGPGYADATGNLRLYMAQLRRKLEPDPARPRWLLTEPGMGYRFQPDQGAGPSAAAIPATPADSASSAD